MKLKLVEKFYKNKRVLIIGHTGFKGSWLTMCLKKLNAKIYGISIDVPTQPSHFNLLGIKNSIKDYRIDIRDYKKLQNKIVAIKPDIIFHLAAQSLVKESYLNPYSTWTTNLIGTINLLDILKNSNLKKKISVVIITSDKCYKNLNQKKRYNEKDLLGDQEPYGASKASAELAFASYFESFLYKKKNIRLGTARAGNVIGGGDWSKDRIFPDLIRSIKSGKLLKIRYPNSTRPWQHVLEPVFGYMYLGYDLYNKIKNNGQSFNFGPQYSKNYKVIELLNEFKKHNPQIKWKVDKSNKKVNEAGLLNLNSDKSFRRLKWKNILNFKNTIKMTSDWYSSYIKNGDMQKITVNQIGLYKIKLKKKS